MNAIASFRVCKLTDEQLIKRIDEKTDEIFRNPSDNFPRVLYRSIPARPDEDYDILIGELILRFKEKVIDVENKNNLIPLSKGNKYIIAGSSEWHDGIEIDGKFYMKPEHTHLKDMKAAECTKEINLPTINETFDKIGIDYSNEPSQKIASSAYIGPDAALIKTIEKISGVVTKEQKPPHECDNLDYGKY
jgi:hypothetical protein